MRRQSIRWQAKPRIPYYGWSTDLGELEVRWEKTLTATHTAAANHPGTYRKLKTVATEIVSTPIDDYFPTVEKLINLLEILDPCGQESIFRIFKVRISPSSIWDVKMFRMECRDLLAHLYSFDEWRRRNIRLFKSGRVEHS